MKDDLLSDFELAVPDDMVLGDAASNPPPLSKRAARRLIQRALVLVTRDRQVRQHVREVRAVTLWVLEDWKFAWTVELDRGKIHFARRPARRPDLTFIWQIAAEFFNQIERGVQGKEALEVVGDPMLRKLLEPLFRCFCHSLLKVMRYPFDDEGNRLV